jgi:hypothetical protein
MTGRPQDIPPQRVSGTTWPTVEEVRLVGDRGRQQHGILPLADVSEGLTPCFMLGYRIPVAD